MSRASPAVSDSLLIELWRRGVWRVLPILFLYVTGMTVLSPIKPSIMTDFFASRAANQTMRCDDFQLNAIPKACQDAHAQVVTWSSWSDFVANAVLAFFMAPVIGRWSDAYGRKPFLVLSFTCGGAQVVALLLYITMGTSLFWYFPAQALVGAFSCISLCLAYVADLMPPQHRGASFGFIMASFSFGVVIGPLTGALLTPLQAAWVAVGACAFNCVYTAVLLPESLSPAAKRLARQRQGSEGVGSGNGLLHGLRMLSRSRLFMKLTACVMLTGIVMEGMYELLAQYFQLKLGYTAQDQSRMLVCAGCAGLVVNTLVLRFLLKSLGETRVLYIGLMVSCLQQLGIAFAWNKPLSIAAVALGSLGNVSFPAISSIKSNSVPRHEQGAIQGALYGARSLAMGMGPVLFAALFSLFSRSDSTVPYFPGAPFICGCVLCLVGLIVALTIRSADVKKSEVIENLTTPLLYGEDVQNKGYPAGGPDIEAGLDKALPKLPELAADSCLPASSPIDVLRSPIHSPYASGPVSRGDGRLMQQCADSTEGSATAAQDAAACIMDTDKQQVPVSGHASTLDGRDYSGIVQKSAFSQEESPRKEPAFCWSMLEGDRCSSLYPIPDSDDSLSSDSPATCTPAQPIPDGAAGQSGRLQDNSEQIWRRMDSLQGRRGSYRGGRISESYMAPQPTNGRVSEPDLALQPSGGHIGEPDLALYPRRSVDARMADAATLPMAAFGGNGMETASAVLRNLMASHDTWRADSVDTPRPSSL